MARAQMLMEQALDRLCEVMPLDTALDLVEQMFVVGPRRDGVLDTLSAAQLRHVREVVKGMHGEITRTMH